MANTSSYSYQKNPATRDKPWVKWSLIGIAVVFMGVMLVVPLVSVFYEALKKDGRRIKKHCLSLTHLHPLS